MGFFSSTVSSSVLGCSFDSKSWTVKSVKKDSPIGSADGLVVGDVIMSVSDVSVSDYLSVKENNSDTFIRMLETELPVLLVVRGTCTVAVDLSLFSATLPGKKMSGFGSDDARLGIVFSGAEWKVHRMMDGGAADVDGSLKIGDMLSKVDDWELPPASSPARLYDRKSVMMKLRGPIGSSVKLTMIRGDGEVDVTLTRGGANAKPVSGGAVVPSRREADEACSPQPQSEWGGAASIYTVHLSKGLAGYGISFAQSPVGPTVCKVFPETEAGRAGIIQPGDVLIEVNGISMEGRSFNEIIDLVKDLESCALTMQGSAGF